MAMVRPRCIPPCMLGVAGAAALSASFSAPAQEIDNRPIYYVMLKSLESGFKTYNDQLVSALEERLAGVRAQYDSTREEIAAAFEKLEAERDRRVSTFTAERDALNERIEDLNERIALRDGLASEARRIDERHADDPQVQSLTESLAAERARLATLEEEYRTELEAIREARAELTRRFEEYTSAGDPLALEIRSLEQEWRRFAEGERRKLKELADSYAGDYAAYSDWLERERAALDALGAELASAVETDREQRALHARLEAQLRALIDEYNSLVEVHNAAGSDDPDRDARAARFAAMEERIAALQADLARAREKVIEVNEEFRTKRNEYDERHARFIDEKRERESRLAGDLADINAARVAIETEIDTRRQKVDAQIRALEAQISSELEGARRNLETLTRRLMEDFGRDHEGLDAAIDQFLDDDDDRLLYTEEGTPRFDLSRPKTAAVYRSVEQMLTDRRRIDARIVALQSSDDASQGSDGDTSPPTAALERQRAAFGAERQQLLEAHASFAREHQSRTAALEQRLDALDEGFAEDRARLEALFSLRADVTRSEFELVQQVLVAAIRGRARKSVDRDEYTRLLEELREQSQRMGVAAHASIVDPHALLDHIGSGLPSDVGGNSGWQPFSPGEVVDSRPLGGDAKAKVAAAWLARYRDLPGFATTARALDETGAVASGDEALATLFLDGVISHMSVDEQRLEDGGVGIRIGVLGRAYELQANGSLEPLPDG